MLGLSGPFYVGLSGCFWALLGLSVRLCASPKLFAFLWACLCIRMFGFRLGAQSWPAHLSSLGSRIISLERTVVLKRHQFSTDFCLKQHQKPLSKATMFQHVSKMRQGAMKYNLRNKNTPISLGYVKVLSDSAEQLLRDFLHAALTAHL